MHDAYALSSWNLNRKIEPLRPVPDAWVLPRMLSSTGHRVSGVGIPAVCGTEPPLTDVPETAWFLKMPLLPVAEAFRGSNGRDRTPDAGDCIRYFQFITGIPSAEEHRRKRQTQRV